MDREFSTPMMLQYMDIKKRYPDCLLFFRLGDFYELFLEDAVTGSRVLNITLTARPRGKDGDVPMAGVPYHASEHYLAKLVKAGYKVAICEQVTEPDNKGLVDREVVRIVTPGTVFNEFSLQQNENNYVVSITRHLERNTTVFGLAFADISTGNFFTTQIVQHKSKRSQVLDGESDEIPTKSEVVDATRNDTSKTKLGTDLEQQLITELLRFRPSECILSHELYNDIHLLGLLKKVHTMNVFPFSEWEVFTSDAKKYIQECFGVTTLRGFGIDSKKAAISASAVLLGYLNHTQQQVISHIKKIESYKPDQFVVLDRSTITNLELFETITEAEKSGSLLSVIDQTRSAAGGRLLKKWLLHPLKTKSEIEKRLLFVEEALFNRNLRTEIVNTIDCLYDIERIIAKLSVGLANPGDILNLKVSLGKSLEVKKILSQFNNALAAELVASITSDITTVIDWIETRILHDPKIDIKSGGIIQHGINSRLDELRKISGGGKNWVKEFESKERLRTGITSLKVKYNKVFGYYIEISKANLENVPKDYNRKQTLVNAERFITNELKDYEDLILNADEEIGKLEYQLFLETVEGIVKYTQALQDTAYAMAVTDVLMAFGVLAEKERYVKPSISLGSEIKIIEGRHPVVEKNLQDALFVPNDVLLNNTDHQLLIITGPNMAGKSVYMRQTAILVLLAHIGSFVPAKSAEICLVDRIFVRSGASDIISSGLSTFMVEMVETAHILNHATNKSLIIMDEIGRGTSTFDGISIAWAVAEYLVNSGLNAKTLFATHYHELQQLAERYPGKIKNYQVAIEDTDGEPVFLHKVIAGGASHSFGVAVATLAGLPKSITQNAIEILSILEEKGSGFLGTQLNQNSARNSVINQQTQLQLQQFQGEKQKDLLITTEAPSLDKQSFFSDVVQQLSSLELDSMTPIEAMQLLAKLKQSCKENVPTLEKEEKNTSEQN